MTDWQTDYELTHKPKITRLHYTKYVFALTILQNLSLWHMYLGQLLLCSTWMTFENSFLHQCLDCKMHQVTWELAHHLNESGPLYSFKIGEAFHLMITPIPKQWRYNPAHTLSQATLSLSFSNRLTHFLVIKLSERVSQGLSCLARLTCIFPYFGLIQYSSLNDKQINP